MPGSAIQTFVFLFLLWPLVQGKRSGWMDVLGWLQGGGGISSPEGSLSATPSPSPSVPPPVSLRNASAVDAWEVITTGRASPLNDSPFQLASILCHPAPQPSIAYMFSGHPRTFANPKVHLSFLQNVVHAFGARPVFFFYFKTSKISYNDGYVTNQLVDGAHISGALRAEVEVALQLFQPRVVVWAEDEDVSGEFNAKCDLYNRDGTPQPPLWRFLSQWRGLQHALNLVLDYEKRQGTAFDWVMKLRPDVLWYHGLKPYCGYNRGVAYNPSTFLGGPVPYYDWHCLVRGDLAKEAFDTLGQYRACVGTSFPHSTMGDTALTNLVQQGKLVDTNKNSGASFLPGYILRDCAQKDNEFCQYMGSPLYFANGQSECDTLLHAC
jgi:hypothetical protein